MDVVDILKIGLPGLVFLLSLLSYRLLTQEQAKNSPNANMLKGIKTFMSINIVLAILTAITPIVGSKFGPSSHFGKRYSAEVRVTSDSLPAEQAYVCSHVEYGNRWLLITNESRSKMLQVFGNSHLPCSNEDRLITLDKDDATWMGISEGVKPFSVGLVAAEAGQKYVLHALE